MPKGIGYSKGAKKRAMKKFGSQGKAVDLYSGRGGQSTPPKPKYK